jgi:hypothetical protein
MAYLDLTAMNAALKELYDGQVVENLVYADNPFLAMVPNHHWCISRSFCDFRECLGQPDGGRNSVVLVDSRN